MTDEKAIGILLELWQKYNRIVVSDLQKVIEKQERMQALERGIQALSERE